MRTKNCLYFFIFFFLLMIGACKKDPATKKVEFKSTTYQTLGTYNYLGKPDNLLKDAISPSLLSFIYSSLPDTKDLTVTHPELFSNPEIADVTITQTSDVFITFVSQDGRSTNSIAFYTYLTNQPPVSAKDIKLITYVFPNSGNLTALEPGDKVKIGTFEAGTSVGFVLLKDSWDTTSHTLNNNVVHFCSNDALNPEVNPHLKKHAVLINYAPENKILIGFEDIDRTKPECDNDFNDVVIYCTVIKL